MRRRRERHAVETGKSRRGKEPQRIPAAPPLIADAFVGVENDERHAALTEVIPDREAGLTGADDDCVITLF